MYRTNDPLFNYLATVSYEINPKEHPKYFYIIKRISAWSFETLKVPIRLRWVIDMEAIMASQKFDWSYATVSLTENDKPKISNFVDLYENDMHALLDIFAEDYVKVSMTYSENQVSWCITLTPQDDNKFNSKISMTTWSINPIEALWMAGYKHVVICNRAEYPVEANKERWG